MYANEGLKRGVTAIMGLPLRGEEYLVLSDSVGRRQKKTGNK